MTPNDLVRSERVILPQYHMCDMRDMCDMCDMRDMCDMYILDAPQQTDIKPCL